MSSLHYMWSLWGGFALTYLIHSTCLLSLCWLVTRVVDRRFHTFRLQAWKCAALLGIVSSSFALMSNTVNDLRLGWSIVPSQQDFQWPESSQEAQVEIVPNTNAHDAINSISTSALAMSSEDPAPAGIVPVPVSIAEPASEMEIDPAIAVPSIKAEPTVTWPASKSQLFLLNTFTGIALMSSVLGMIRFAFQWHKYRCLMQSCQPCSQRVIRLLRGVQKHSTRQHNIKLLVNARAMQPFATGLLQWKVVLPLGLESELEDEELYALLAHEIGHLRRGDIMWQWIYEFVCNCFVIQPLNFVARRQWQCASEFLADRWSCEHGRASPMALAKCLTSVAARSSAVSQTAPLASAFTEKPGNLLVARVGQLLLLTPVPSTSRSNGWIVRIATGVVFGVICLLAGFAPHCIPNLALGSEIGPSPIASQASVQWSAAELELTGLRHDVEQLVDVLQTQQSSPEVSQIIQDLELRTASLTERATTIRRKIQNKENK